jgi:hypothetical protein
MSRGEVADGASGLAEGHAAVHAATPCLRRFLSEVLMISEDPVVDTLGHGGGPTRAWGHGSVVLPMLHPLLQLSLSTINAGGGLVQDIGLLAAGTLNTRLCGKTLMKRDAIVPVVENPRRVGWQSTRDGSTGISRDRHPFVEQRLQIDGIRPSLLAKSPRSSRRRRHRHSYRRRNFCGSRAPARCRWSYSQPWSPTPSTTLSLGLRTAKRSWQRR